jgi:hypothetical protein
MKENKDIRSEIGVVKRSLSSKEKEKLDDIIKHAKLLYEDLFESDVMRHLDQMPFLGQFADIIERLEKFRKKEL